MNGLDANQSTHWRAFLNRRQLWAQNELLNLVALEASGAKASARKTSGFTRGWTVHDGVPEEPLQIIGRCGQAAARSTSGQRSSKHLLDRRASARSDVVG